MLRQSATPYQIRFEANDSPSGDALSNGKCVQQVGEAILHEPVYEKPPVVVYRREHEHSESENKSQSHQLFAAESKIALHKKKLVCTRSECYVSHPALKQVLCNPITFSGTFLVFRNFDLLNNLQFFISNLDLIFVFVLFFIKQFLFVYLFKLFFVKFTISLFVFC